MLERAALGDGWRVWSEEDDRVVLAYRPDVFDGSEYPAACLPTIYVARGRRTRRPEGNRNLPPDAPWTVTLFLEPDVEYGPETYDGLADALRGAEALSRRFADGDVDYRGLYQVPQEAYFEELDALTGSRRRA
jgi:hypothetical protein